MVQSIYEKLKQADALARKNHEYAYDKPGEDQWRSFANVALQGKKWYGDCDDLASTTCDIAVRLGVPLKNLWFVHVSSTRNGRTDHMIAFGKDEKGKLWVIGDTFGPCYPVSQMSHGPSKPGARFSCANLMNVMDWDHGKGGLTLQEIAAR